jgi:hypothetical protein
MPLYTDLPETDDERQAMLKRALTDRTRCVVLGNQFDLFDYAAAKKGINEFVEHSFHRITSIVSTTLESADGSAVQTTRSGGGDLRAKDS